MYHPRIGRGMFLSSFVGPRMVPVWVQVHTCMDRGMHFSRSDTRNRKLIRVWAYDSELAFNVFMKVVALDVNFHFLHIPHHYELLFSRYDQNTTHLSWCQTCWKIDSVKLSEKFVAFVFRQFLLLPPAYKIR